MQQLSEQATTIDFAHYRSTLKNQAVVDEIEKRFKAFKPVTYDVNRQLKAIDAFEAEAVKNAVATKEAVDLELKDLAATLTNIEEARPFEDLTVVRADPREMVGGGADACYRTRSLPPKSQSTRRPRNSFPRADGWCRDTRYVDDSLCAFQVSNALYRRSLATSPSCNGALPIIPRIPLVYSSSVDTENLKRQISVSAHPNHSSWTL